MAEWEGPLDLLWKDPFYARVCESHRRTMGERKSGFFCLLLRRRLDRRLHAHLLAGVIPLNEKLLFVTIPMEQQRPFFSNEAWRREHTCFQTPPKKSMEWIMGTKLSPLYFFLQEPVRNFLFPPLSFTSLSRFSCLLSHSWTSVVGRVPPLHHGHPPPPLSSRSAGRR